MYTKSGVSGMAYANTFQRMEIKYLLTSQQTEAVLQKISGFMIEDEYSRQTVCSLYCDSPDDILARISLDKPVYKEKLRLRSYGRADREHPVFMELKKKYRSIVYKRRLTLPYGRALDCLTGDCPWPETQIGREIGYAMDFYPDLEPRVFLSYERDSWYAPESGLRITFDDAIRFRTADLTLDSDLWGTALLRPDQVLMELKAPGAIPLWMVRLLTEMGLYKTSFSKYGTAYQILLEQEYKGGKRYA